MKMMKNIIAFFLVSVMLLSFAGCHEKDEIAVKIGDVEFTSAYYMCALINADTEAQSKVYQNLTDAEKKQYNIDFYSKKIDGKDYTKWVKDTAIDSLKTIAAYITLCKNNKVVPTDSQKNSSREYAEFYWYSYGYSQLFEPNGVSKKTFVKYMSEMNLSSVYFDYLYAKDGKKEISQEEINKKMADSFVLADSISTEYKDSSGKPLTDEKKKEMKEKFQGYAAALKDGSKTFEEIFKEYNDFLKQDNKKDDETSSSSSSSSSSSTDSSSSESSSDTSSSGTSSDTTSSDDKDKLKPIYPHASILGAEKTGFENEHFESVKSMSVNEVKLIELEKESGIVIFVKRDLSSDKYYVDSIDSAIRHLLRDDEFEKEIKETKKSIKTEINDYAVNRFKVKKIKYPKGR